MQQPQNTTPQVQLQQQLQHQVNRGKLIEQSVVEGMKGGKQARVNKIGFLAL